MRRIAKRVAEACLMPIAHAAMLRLRRSGGTGILAYHNVVTKRPSHHADTSLHLDFDQFRRQLDLLQRQFHVVSLPDAVGSPVPGTPSLAITFDDAYQGCIRLAIPELIARRLPATVFVTPGLLGQPGFWWDMVLTESRDGVPESTRDKALATMAGRQMTILETLPSRVYVDDDLKPATEGQLVELKGSAGVHFASHTWGHLNLSVIGKDEIRSELARAHEWLAARLGTWFLPSHMSFPYGLWNQTVLEVASELGIEHLYRVDGGVIRSDPGPDPLPRVNVPAGASHRGFFLRAVGLVR